MVGVVMALMAAPNSAVSNSFCMFIRYLFKARGFGDCECLGPVAYLFFQCAESVFRCAENVNSSRNDIDGNNEWHTQFKSFSHKERNANQIGARSQNTQRSFAPSALFRRAVRNALRFFSISMMWGRGVVPSASAATSIFVCESVMQHLLAMVRIVKADECGSDESSPTDRDRKPTSRDGSLKMGLIHLLLPAAEMLGVRTQRGQWRLPVEPT
jgi:hypothetical protein